MSVLNRERGKNLLFADMSTNGLGEEWGLTTKIFFLYLHSKEKKMQHHLKHEFCKISSKIIRKAESIDMHINIQYTCNSYFLVSEKKVTVPNFCFLVGRLFFGHFVSLYWIISLSFSVMFHFVNFHLLHL